MSRRWGPQRISRSTSASATFATPMTFTYAVLQSAHTHCFRNRAEVSASTWCGCFYCRTVFPASEIAEWTDSAAGIETTALCPRCGIDSVIGDRSGYEISAAFLEEMHLRFFMR